MSTDTPSSSDGAPAIRGIIYALGLANGAFWLWTFHFIAAHSNPKGDGMEWMAAMPFTVVFFAGVLLPVMRVVKGPDKGPGLNINVALLLSVAAAVANALLYVEIASEFAH